MEKEVRKETVKTEKGKNIDVTLYRREVDILDKNGIVTDTKRYYWGDITGMDGPASIQDILKLPLPPVDDTRQVYLLTENKSEYYINKKGEVYTQSPGNIKQVYVGKISLESTEVVLGQPAKLNFKNLEIAVYGGFQKTIKPMSIGIIRTIRYSEEKV